MGFSDVATEIRLKICSELLVLSEPIEFVANVGPTCRTSFDLEGMGSIQMFFV
jgi:hypothetical protein